MTTQRQRAAVIKAIAAVWESHGDGYLSPGLFEAVADAALEAAAAARPKPPAVLDFRCDSCDKTEWKYCPWCGCGVIEPERCQYD